VPEKATQTAGPPNEDSSLAASDDPKKTRIGEAWESGGSSTVKMRGGKMNLGNKKPAPLDYLGGRSYESTWP